MPESPVNPSSDDGCCVHTLDMVFVELEAIGLSEPVAKPTVKKAGHPKKESANKKNKRFSPRPKDRHSKPRECVLICVNRGRGGAV
jgi:hypothetical protein